MAADLKAQLQERIKSSHVLVFSKTTCPFCDRVKRLLQVQCVTFTTVELDKEDNGADIQAALIEITGQKTVPNVFVNGNHVGGCSDTIAAHSSGALSRMILEGEQARDPFDAKNTYDYDLIVIGGGSGGLACSKAAGVYDGVRVCCLDFVKPSPRGTKWGLGGTCVNVGCIPKKLMHQAALLGQALEDARKFGWEFSQEVRHNWSVMVEGIQNHIGSLNWGYRTALSDKNVKYANAKAEFIDPHTIKHVNKRGVEKTVTAARFVIATGGRPRYPDIPGAKEYGITSDDLFSLTDPPGKTLVIGASYVALECAGFLAGIGFDVTCMVRSILLRGFDQQMADKAGEYMEGHKVKFIRHTVPIKVELVEEGMPRRLKVEFKNVDTGAVRTEEYNTVLFAIGRIPDVEDLKLENAGVHYNPKTKHIPTVYEQTNMPHIYAIGDVQEGKEELTPMAIQSGRLLANRMFGGSKENADYINVATTVFTPLEYGCVGLAEEDALKIYGETNIEVYHMHYQPLEFTVAGREENQCYIKLICNKNDKERVLGLHVLSPNAGEITQGYAVAMKLGATKADFDSTIGIHPTCSENFTTLSITKSSGVSSKTTGC